MSNPPEILQPKTPKKVSIINNINNPEIQKQIKMQMHQKCVCQLCSCGKHRCPKPKLRGIYQTSYKDHYKQFNINANKGYQEQYKYQQRHYNPQYLKSNYQQQYKAKEMQPFQSLIPQPPPKKNIALSQETQYNKRYQIPQMDKNRSKSNTNNPFQSAARNIILPNAVKFDANTSYKDHYKGFTIENQNKSLDYSVQTIKSPIKFQGTSNYKANFTPHSPVVTKPFIMEPNRIVLPFKGTSTYKDHYIGNNLSQPALSKNYLDSINIQNPNLKNLEKAKFEGNTSYNEHYKNLPVLSQKKNICPCQVINIPKENLLEKPHLHYDGTKNQWI